MGDSELAREVNHATLHTYVLARDEGAGIYNGPAWVPFNLWHWREFQPQHPLVSECAAKLIEHPDAESLWTGIALRYERPDNIAVSLPVICANAMAAWQALPKMTPAQYKAQREGLARKAKQLATELERFFLACDPDREQFTGLLDFTQLMTDQELARFHNSIVYTTVVIANRARRSAGVREWDWDEYNDTHGGTARSLAAMDTALIYALLLQDHDDPDDQYGGVPTLPVVLRRIADQCTWSADDAPLTRPNAQNTERNRFAQAVIRYFWTSYRDVSPNLVARIVSIFFAQGITENEVSQMIPKIKRASEPIRLVPLGTDDESETSHTK